MVEEEADVGLCDGERTMVEIRKRHLRLIEGQQVNVALRDGRRIDDCNLVSAGRSRANSLWLFVNGQDVFVAHDDVIDIWSEHGDRPWAA
jgi:hypothetical protein